MEVKRMTTEELDQATGFYQYWNGIPTLLRSPYRPDMSDTDVGLIGFPYSGGNSIERMQYHGPRAVRHRSSAYRRAHRGFQLDPFETLRVSDLGDVPLPNILIPMYRPWMPRSSTRKCTSVTSSLSPSAVTTASQLRYCAQSQVRTPSTKAQ